MQQRGSTKKSRLRDATRADFIRNNRTYVVTADS